MEECYRDIQVWDIFNCAGLVFKHRIPIIMRFKTFEQHWERGGRGSRSNFFFCFSTSFNPTRTKEIWKTWEYRESTFSIASFGFFSRALQKSQNLFRKLLSRLCDGSILKCTQIGLSITNQNYASLYTWLKRSLKKSKTMWYNTNRYQDNYNDV